MKENVMDAIKTVCFKDPDRQVEITVNHKTNMVTIEETLDGETDSVSFITVTLGELDSALRYSREVLPDTRNYELVV